MSKLGSVPLGAPFWLMRACVCTCTLTFNVAPSMGIGTLVANAAGASMREVARTALRVAFIGNPFRVSLLYEEAGALVEETPSCTAGTLRKDDVNLQIVGREKDRLTRPATPCASRG